jgi:hypothetical protein
VGTRVPRIIRSIPAVASEIGFARMWAAVFGQVTRPSGSDRSHREVFDIADLASASNDLASRQSASHASCSADRSLRSSPSSLTQESAGSLNQDSSFPGSAARSSCEPPAGAARGQLGVQRPHRGPELREVQAIEGRDRQPRRVEAST